MSVVNLAGMGVLAMLLVLIAIEFMAPARTLVPAPGWRLKCLLFVPVVLGLSTGVPLLLSALANAPLLPGHKLGLLGGTLVGIFSSELLVYWTHRLHHKVDLLWRWVHQLHHSAERMDVFGAAFFHPFEIIESAVLGVLFFSLVLGLPPQAAGLCLLWQGFHGVFQHGNIKTPQWLGYLIQRPEQHCVHHERGVHGYNYANLPFWDLLFGTFKNPKSWAGESGFYQGSSKPVLRMLMGRDVSESCSAFDQDDSTL